MNFKCVVLYYVSCINIFVLGIPTSTKTSSISSVPSSTSNVKDEVSTGPKLKDFLPYMKNRNNIQQPHSKNKFE